MSAHRAEALDDLVVCAARELCRDVVMQQLDLLARDLGPAGVVAHDRDHREEDRPRSQAGQPLGRPLAQQRCEVELIGHSYSPPPPAAGAPLVSFFISSGGTSAVVPCCEMVTLKPDIT